MIRYHLPSLIRRGISFINRARRIKPFAGGVLPAIAILLRIRLDRNAIQSVSYGDTSVRFRGHDEQALYEVLVDEEYAFLADFIDSTPAPTILDVGAHIGTFAIWVFGVNAKAKVLSIEADPQTYRVTELNGTAFAKGGAEWQVIHGAAGSEDGSVLLLSDAGPSMSHHIDSDGTVEVRGISLTALLDKIAPSGASVDLVKIDIEGSEEAFLCTSPDALKRVGSLVIELHPQLCDTDCVQLLLEEYFDHIEDIGGRKSTKPLLYCRRNVTAKRA